MNKNNQIKVCDFSEREIQTFLNCANFTDDERNVFLLRNREYTLERIAEEMNISVKTAYRLNKKMKEKIIKVCSEDMAIS